MYPFVSHSHTNHRHPAKTRPRGLARMVNLLLLLLAGLTRIGGACRRVVGVFHRKAIIFVSTFRHRAFRSGPPRRTTAVAGRTDKGRRTEHIPHVFPLIRESLCMLADSSIIHARRAVIPAQKAVSCVQEAVIHVRKVVIHTLKTIMDAHKAVCRNESIRPAGGLQTGYAINHQRHPQEDLKSAGGLQMGYAINFIEFIGKIVLRATPIVAGLPTIGRSVSADAVPTLALSHTSRPYPHNFFAPPVVPFTGDDDIAIFWF